MLRMLFLCRALILSMLLVPVVSKTSADAMSSGGSKEGGGMLLYTDISAANTSSSLSHIRRIPLSFYEFAYDSVPGRRQVGVLPKDAAKYFPESVEVVESYTFPPKKRGDDPIIVPNFPVVDKNVIFMHGLAALQELLQVTEELQKSIESMSSDVSSEMKSLNKIEASINRDYSEKVAAFNRLSAAEIKKDEALERLRLTSSEEDKKLATAVLEEEAKVLKYQEQAVIERLEKERALAKESAAQVLSAEREMNARTETLYLEAQGKLQEKRIALERELTAKKTDAEKEKIRAQSDAKIRQEKASEEIAIRRIQEKGRLDSERAMQSIRLVFKEALAIVNEVMSNPERMLLIVAVVLALLATYYLLREAIALLREFVQSQIGKPALVRETSHRMSVPRALLAPFSALLGPRLADVEKDTRELEEHFADVILSPALKRRIVSLAVATRNTNRSGANYRHVLLHGPPGTGKTLIARTLAQSSGMDYAVMSGGDVGPLGEDAVSQLHKLFRWAQTSDKGLMVFIDEAEAFLHSRDMNAEGEDSLHRRHALNALLYQTGTQSTKLLLVLATNRPADLDEAVVDRMDSSLLIDLPSAEERVKLCRLYIQHHVQGYADAHNKRSASWWPWARRSTLEVDESCAADKSIDALAEMVKGFSGREISKLFIAAQHAMLLAPEGKFTNKALQEVVAAKLQEHKAQAKWGQARSKDET